MSRTALAILTTTIMMSAITPIDAAVKIEKTQYAGWPNCYRISNGEIELVVTTDVGPRIIRYGFVGGQNLFKEFTEQTGKSGESTWQARGGHRLWIAPEDRVLSYALDNSPIKVEIKGAVIELTGGVEPETELQKQIIVSMAASGSDVEVVHRITNHGKAREFAPWSLTMMAQRGVAVVTFPPRGTHPKDLQPTNPLVMWAFTDFSDKRWQFTKKYLILRQDPKNPSPQKTGLFNADTVGAYVLGTDLFIKRSSATDARKQPDFGCSFETFTNDTFLELETLGEVSNVRTGASVEHVERWSLHRGIRISSWTDAELDRVLLPILQP
jgi:hypothetical protein